MGERRKPQSRKCSAPPVNPCPVGALESVTGMREMPRQQRLNPNAIYIVLSVATSLLMWVGLIYAFVAVMAALG